MDTAHELVALLKQAAAEIGHRPTRDEFIRHVGISRHKIDRVFGTFTELAKATFGEAPKQEDSHKKRIQTFFQRDVEELIKNTAQAAKLSHFGVEKQVLCLPDKHAPWMHQDSIAAVYCLIEVLKPDIIISLGDDFDLFSFGKFPRSHMIIRPDEEVSTARKQLEVMWETIRKLAPKAELINLKGNHCARAFKRLLETDCPQLEIFMDMKSLFNFDGVRTIHDIRDIIMIEGVHYTHGHLKHGNHRAITHTHAVHGHTHNSGLILNKINGKLLWELDCGYLGDPTAPCFNYMPKKTNNWTRGVGFVGHLGPVFIPLE